MLELVRLRQQQQVIDLHAGSSQLLSDCVCCLIAPWCLLDVPCASRHVLHLNNDNNDYGDL